MAKATTKTGSKPVTLLEVLGIDGCIQSICKGSARDRAAPTPSRDKPKGAESPKLAPTPARAKASLSRTGSTGSCSRLYDEAQLCVGEDIWTPLGGWSAGPHQPASAPPTEAALALAQVKELARKSSARWTAADNTPAGSAEAACLDSLAQYWHHAEAFVPVDEELRWAGLGAEVEATERRRKARIAQWQAETGLHIAESGGRVGLLNLRNTCWMNSVLQLLAHLGPFTALMLSMDEEKSDRLNALDLTNPMKKQVSNGSSEARSDNLHRRASCPEARAPSEKIVFRVRELLQNLWQDHNSSAVSPSRLHVALMRLAPWFIRRGMREDALEFFAFLLQQMHEELENKAQPQPKDGQEMPEMIDLRAWVTCLNSSRSPINTLFQGRQLSTVTCTQCGFFSQRPEDFLHISIPIKSATLDALAKPIAYDESVPRNIRKKDRNRSNYFGVIKLQDALGAVTAEEVLNGENCWECEKCKKKVEATKKVQLDMMPPVLIVHLLRFSYDPLADAVVKMRGQVELPDNWQEAGVDLSRHCTKADHTCLYDVLGMVNHHGPDTSNGHYTACCKHDVDGSWYLFNDGQVETVDPSEAYLPECAYVICLGRRHCKAPVIRSNPQGDMRSWASSGFESFADTDSSDEDGLDTAGPSAPEDESNTREPQDTDEDRDRPHMSVAERGGDTSTRQVEVSACSAETSGREVEDIAQSNDTSGSYSEASLWGRKVEASAPTASNLRQDAARPPPGARRMEDSGRPPPGARRTERA